MAKISETQLQLLRPDFSQSNELMNSGIQSLLDTLTGVKTQVDEGFAERKANATGSILEQISQSMPVDYNSNPESRAAFDNQISQFAASNGLAREGVNKQDLFTTLNTMSAERDTNRGEVLANQGKGLANDIIQDEQLYNQAFNDYSAGKIGKEEYLARTNGLVVNRQNNQNKTTIDNLAIAKEGFTPQLELAKLLNENKLAPMLEKLGYKIDKTIYENEGKTTGKGQAPSYQGGQSSGSLNGGAVTPAVAKYSPMINNAANKHGLSADLIASMMTAESGGDPNARSSAGAGGLMQVMPTTWDSLSKGDRFDPNTNIDVGSAYMAQQLSKYSKYGDDALKIALMAYNWGPGNTDNWLKNGGKIPKETTDYVAKVTGNLNNARSGQQQQAPVVDPASVITYNNKNQTRSLPASDKLTSAVAPVLSQMGLTMKVHSGGQNDETGRVGSKRHDHGDSVDADFYQGDRKLSFNNPEDIPVLQEMVQRLKANGLTGFGAGDGYMTDGRMHIGYGSNAVWGGDGSNASAYDWLKQAASSDVSGYSSTGQLYQQANQSSMRPEDLDALRELSGQVGAREDSTFDKLYLGMKNAAPDPINPPLFSDYQSPEMLSQRNQGLMNTLTGIEDGNIDTVNQLSQVVTDFDTAVRDRSQTIEDAQARLAADMAANGGDIVEVGNYVKKQDMFKKWLFESAITPEMFNSYPTDIQGALIKQQMTREQNFGKKDRESAKALARMENNLLTNDASYAEQAKNRIAQRAEARRAKEVDNVGSIAFGLGKNSATKALEKRNNFETSIAIYIDQAIKENPETFKSEDAGYKYLIGTDNKNIDLLLDSTIQEYDKIVSQAKDPKTEYLSKNLTGTGMFLSGKAIKEAVNTALLKHSKGVNRIIKKNINIESTDADLAASDVIANIALTGNLKKGKN